MTEAQLGRFEILLKAKQSTLAQTPWRLDGIGVERTADPSDEAQFAYERELNIRALDRDSALLSAVRSALRRMGEGEYGVCLACEGEIGEKRLAAIPWAPHCIRCQEILDQTAEHEEPFAA